MSNPFDLPPYEDFLSLLTPLPAWIRVMLVCAALLLVEALIVFVVSWARHVRRRWLLRISMLIPLAASAGAVIAALHIRDLYLYWAPREVSEFDGGPTSQAQTVYFLRELAGAVHETTVLGWIVVIMTSILLMLALVSLADLAIRRRREGRQPALLAAES